MDVVVEQWESKGDGRDILPAGLHRLVPEQRVCGGWVTLAGRAGRSNNDHPRNAGQCLKRGLDGMTFNGRALPKFVKPALDHDKLRFMRKHLGDAFGE